MNNTKRVLVVGSGIGGATAAYALANAGLETHCIDIQPASAPSLVVSLSHLRSDPALTVGTLVTAATSKIGTVLDFSRVERQALARYTQDAGNHVSVEVSPAATLAIP